MLVPAYGIPKTKRQLKREKKQTLRKIKYKNSGYEVKKHDRSFRFSSEQAIRLLNQACVCIQTIFHRPFNIGVYTHMVWCGVFSCSSIQCGVIFFVPFPSIQMMWSVSFFSFCRWSSTLSLATAGQEANKQKKIYKVDDSPASKCRQACWKASSWTITQSDIAHILAPGRICLNVWWWCSRSRRHCHRQFLARRLLQYGINAWVSECGSM